MVAVIKSTSFLVICAVIIVTHMQALRSPSAAAGSHHDLMSFFPTADSSTVCQGSMAECLAGSAGDDFDFDMEEFQMDSETNRRMLQARRRYISYGALSRNTVPCSRRGASYYNCRNGAQANPYSRGCSTITRCRR